MAYYLDYSAAKLSGPVIATAGFTGVIRYIDEPSRLGTKHTNPNEYQSDLAAGLVVHLVMEVSTSDANGGFAQGVAYAKRSLAGANYIGYKGVIFFCNDSPSLPSSTLWDDYLTGAASVLGWDRVGAYGFYGAMDVAASMTDCRYFWQAGRRSDVRPFVNFWQDNNTQVMVGGITCDRNLVLKAIEEDDVAFGDDVNSKALIWRVKAFLEGKPTVEASHWVEGSPVVEDIVPNQRLAALEEKVAAFTAAQAAPVPVAIDYDRIIDGLAAKLTALEFKANVAT